MRVIVAGFSLLLLFLCTGPAFALEAQQPEAIAEKMSFKMVRGVTNVVTGIVEVPKQSYITVRDRGKIGYVVGPIKGVGMALYRTLLGAVETVFFMVPQPGYYDPMVTPEFVWEGWEKRPEVSLIKDSDATEKGE